MGARTPTPAAPATDAVAEQAAEWIVRLTADDEAERADARRGFEAWKGADPRHAEAAARMEGFVGRMASLRDGPAAAGAHPARRAIGAGLAGNRRGTGRKRLGSTLAALALVVGCTWIGLGVYPPRYLMADLRTPVGAWHTQQLADGTHVTLNSASAVNLRFDARRRAMELVKGEILVDVAKDATRPFLVETAHGSIRALGTRFVVRRDADATVLTMLESKVAVQAAARQAAPHGDGLVVAAGQRVRIGAASVDRLADVDVRGVNDSWKFHQLVVDDRPLAEVLDELNRHRPGRIGYDRTALAGMRISAVLPLDDTDRALRLLLAARPELRLRTLTPWLAWVDMQPVPARAEPR